MVAKTFREEPVTGTHQQVEFLFPNVEFDGSKLNTRKVVDERKRKLESDDSEEVFMRRYVSKEGQMFESSNNGEFSVRFFDESYIMEVTGVNHDRKSVRIYFPEGLQNHCTCVTEKDGVLYIDSISNSFLLYSIKLPFALFEKTNTDRYDSSQLFKQQEDYGIRSRKPLLLKSLKGQADELVLSLCDGGLMKLERQESNGVFLTSLFSDPSYLTSLKDRFFSKDKIASMPHLSIHAIISMAHFDNYLLTVSVNQTLKKWDLNTLMGTEIKFDGDKSKLDTEPVTRVCASGEFFITYCGETIHFWDQNFVNVFSSQIPDIGLWSLKNMAFRQTEGRFEVSTVWMSGVSHVVKKATVDRNGAVEWAECGTPLKMLPPLTVHDYERSVSLYSVPLLKAALSIFSRYGGGGSTISETISSQLRLYVNHNGPDYVGYAKDQVEAWSKFENICQELSRQASACIGSSLSGPTIYILTGTGLDTIRPSTELEKLYDEKNIDGSNLSKLMFTIDRFTSQLTNRARRNIVSFMEEDILALPHYSQANRMVEMMNVLIKEVPKLAYKKLFDSFNGIYNLLDTFEDLASVMDSSRGSIDTAYVMCLDALVSLLLIYNREGDETGLDKNRVVHVFVRFMRHFRTVTIARECAFQKGERYGTLGNFSEANFFEVLAQLPADRAAKLTRFLNTDRPSRFVKGLILLRMGESRKAKRCFFEGDFPSDETLAHFGLPARGDNSYYEYTSKVIAGLGFNELAVIFASRVTNPDTACLINKFRYALAARNYDVAYYTAVAELKHKDNVAELILDMAKHQPLKLLTYPFTSYHPLVDAILASSSLPNKFKLLYAWRVSREDLKGAACALYEQLLVVKQGLDQGMSEKKTYIAELYSSILNVLALQGKDDAWFVSNGRVHTLQDVENEHSQWLAGMVREMKLVMR
ncbi:hypothetical protein CJU90_2759 [Yarrowia sp. C11]|nr:hypothetical protein CKK34_4207 [Yarrowia sp. E02]KAG5369306.1 hypothetical protein CJU90_2759 [Yarrowia sp. C11]